MIHITIPADTPTWVIVISLTGVFLIALVSGLTLLARTVLPKTSAGRLNWWKEFWKHRSNLRHERWERRDQRRLQRHFRDQISIPSGKETSK